MSSRARLYGIVAAAAVAAAGIAVGVAWTGRGPDTGGEPGSAAVPREGPPPLALDVIAADAGEAAGLRSAVTLYEEGEREAARRGFEQVLAAHPDSVEAAVGAAFAAWPDGTVDRLGALAAEHPQSAVVELHLGLVRLWLGDEEGAEAAWLRAEEAEPDSPAAVRAESLRHPALPAGRPFFVPSGEFPPELASLPPLEQLAELELLAEEAAGPGPWILYGVALQRAGRPLSATAAYDRAVELSPESVEALTAAAVARFDKDDPADAFSLLGPISSRFPDEPVVRFHLGLCLLWLRDLEEARRQLEAAVETGAGTVYAAQAAQLLRSLDEAGAAPAP